MCFAFNFLCYFQDLFGPYVKFLKKIIFFRIQNDKIFTTFPLKLYDEKFDNLPLTPKWLLIPRLIIGTAILKTKYKVSELHQFCFKVNSLICSIGRCCHVFNGIVHLCYSV